MQNLINEFKNISSHDDLNKFLGKHHINNDDAKNEAETDKRKSHYKGSIDGMPIEIETRWWDKCKPFQIRPDGNSVRITIFNVNNAVIASNSVTYDED